jgi:DNA segregation ATPase FtsK/SpoIIIE, S-DNA-T family
MAEKKKEKLKEESGKEFSESTESTDLSEGKKVYGKKSARSFFKDQRTRKILGILLIFAGFYAFVSILSYLFTWRNDQDKILADFWDVFGNPEIILQNWLGKTGALISHLLVYRGFGISSMALTILAFFLGLRISFGIKKIPLRRISLNLIFWMVWLSVLLGYLFKSEYSFLGGVVGYSSNLWLHSLTGSLGTPLLLLLSLAIYIIVFRKKVVVLPFENVAAGEDASTLNPLSNQLAQEETVVVEKAKPKAKNWNQPIAEEKESILKKPLEPLVNPEVPLVEKINSDANPVTKEPGKDIQFEIVPAEKKVKSSGQDLELIVSTQPEPGVVPLPALAIEEPMDESEKIPHASGDYDPTLDLSSYQYPGLDLLQNWGGSDSITINNEELNLNKDRILATLRNYGIEIDQIKANVGPTVTLYEIIPAPGVRISKIKNLEDDIALSLSALGIRIIAPIPGKGTIGIEVPNQKAEMVPMKSILASERFQNTSFDLPIALGKTISNETFVADLAKMPHLLMAGATGQGKSVGLNAILVSLLYKKHPAQIKFVLVDPKKVELTLFNTIERHFLAKLPNTAEAIITDTKKVINTLNSLCILMDTRYELLKNAQVRNLKEYNAKFIARKLNPNEGHHFMPYIVLVVDEFADLIMTAGKEVEMPIARLAQLARAIGIHLIIATQRPSVNIITGTIKANFPARIAFRVTSKIDSRTILDSGGAEQLIGRGDMLLSTGNDLIRIQCAFVDTPEVEKITEFIGSQRGYPSAFALPEYEGEEEGGAKEDFDPNDKDPLFNEAAKLIVIHQQGSTSLIQRKLKLGYNRAGRIIDQLEQAGVVGPFEGSKARQVLIHDEQALEQFLNNL